MAQLIKLQDYISRYEWDTFRYPTQFIRLKQENWNKLYKIWSQTDPVDEAYPEFEVEKDEAEEKSMFAKIKSKMKRKNESETIEEEKEADPKVYLPETELELRHYFLDRLFKFQMKWATSTVTHVSFVNKKYYRDMLLTYLLQRFPDNYLVMYHPVLEIKNASLDADILLITPVGIEIVYFLNKGKDVTILAGDERFWTLESPHEKEVKRFLNPTISVKRTENVLKSILATENLEFDIKKTVLSEENNILYINEPYNVNIFGKSDYDLWFQEKRKLASPLKSQQIKVAEVLLKYCQTNAIVRPDWDVDRTPTTIIDLEN